MTDRKKADPIAAAEFPIGGTVVSGESPTAEEPMTEVQAVRLRELCQKLDEPFDGNLTQAQADARIEALENRDKG
ncbi:hypothetical protein OCGS_1148 [Oceaniovalibus guishaninsula JLT2003]|uniref:DUF3072 domain-containing protein n=1 Tax=Oceaniovalibus guishaninsula JLT2003 TaxID=1231392 RepID=K2I6Y3_9RHOB|nr:DUF3072 domain-containing protein [Oceaniovalibus guishaninsula]EKE44765.1 hypothetical protein OCGS_1148 [Oceaniovalibus guishaninsula JLT2003]